MGISNIITKEQDFNYFNKKLAKGKNLKLIFRLTRDGSESGTFHDMCDHIKNTITLVMSEEGNIFGGFASIPWTSELGYKKDEKAYLFSLAQQSIYNVVDKDKAVYHSPHCLSSFGEDDLLIYNGCDEIRGSYSEFGNSYKLSEGIQKDSKEAHKFLAGRKDFKVKEIEVFKFDGFFD